MEIRKNIFHEYLRDGEKERFNAEVVNLKKPVDLENCNLQGVDLRGVNLVDANLKDSYLKSADLRGVDLSHAKLSGASIHKARIGGVLFPKSIDASEIRLSVEYGTRMRER
jgi:uncharacterized protein YjbI with pentapeptide repeats